MTRGKNTIAKEPEAEGEDSFSTKDKVPAIIEIEEREDIMPPIDKLVADPLLEAQSVTDGEESDDLLLDDEEIDPSVL
jgi:hypothetical protein